MVAVREIGRQATVDGDRRAVLEVDLGGAERRARAAVHDQHAILATRRARHRLRDGVDGRRRRAMAPPERVDVVALNSRVAHVT